VNPEAGSEVNDKKLTIKKPVYDKLTGFFIVKGIVFNM